MERSSTIYKGKYINWRQLADFEEINENEKKLF